VLYVAFWILLAMAFAPARWLLRVSLTVLSLTCLLEFLQLWHPPWLEAIRGSFLGHALLGSTFTWLDFPHYALGASAGAALASAVIPAAYPSSFRPPYPPSFRPGSRNPAQGKQPCSRH
jgi:hypothetical protein